MEVYYNENDGDKAEWLRWLMRENVIASGEVDERSIEEVQAQPGWFGAQPDGSAAAAGHVNGFWRDADWVLRKRWNRDDFEWCPTEPGTFPLATGVTNRVLKLRGYGDAICAEVAKAFIEVNL